MLRKATVQHVALEGAGDLGNIDGAKVEEKEECTLALFLYLLMLSLPFTPLVKC